jgi:probable phosphomutase (TIGR03848 family)
MPTILLIRHGENDYVKTQRLAGRLPGVHLNAKGRAQAAGLAIGLKDAKIKAVYSSPLDRAMETAEPLAKALGLKVQKRPNLIETALGDWQGKSIKSLRRKKEWKVLQQTPSRFRFPGGEWMVEQQARLVAEIEAICALNKSKDVLAVVGHADPLKLIVAHYIGMPLDQFQRLMISTASVTTLVLDEGGAMLLSMNQRFPDAKD